MDGMNVTVTLVETVDDLQAFFSWLGQSRRKLAIDCETDGLRWWDGQLRLVQFGDADTSYVIPWEWYPKAITDAINAYEGPICGANFGFDAHWLHRFCKFDPPWHRITDTQTQVHLHEPHLRVALKEAAKRHVHPNAAYGDLALKRLFASGGYSWGDVPLTHPTYWGYAGMDTILTARVDEIIEPQVIASRGELYELERASQATLWRMEERGAMIDREYTAATSVRFQNRIDQLLTWGQTNYGIALGSNQQVITKLMNWGLTWDRRTPSGAIALDDEVLLAIIRDCPGEIGEFTSAVRSVRKLRKLVGTYLDKFLALADGDGLLHASIRQLGARTGRMSVATPSLQNLPRNEEVRASFIPRPENKLVLADFDQIEIRLLAHFSRDPNLIAAILDESIDVHTAAARLIYQDPAMEKGDSRRTTTKNAVFAKVYGAGYRKFALTARIPEAQAEKFMQDYDKTFPLVPNFIGFVIATAKDRLETEGEAYVTTPLGRRETVGKFGNDAYKLVNYLIQGTAADVMKRQMVALDAAGLGNYMTLPVHDEIISDVPEANVEEVSQILMREMPVPAGPYTVPITSDLAVVDCWGDKYKGGNTWIDEAFEDVFAEEIGDV